MPVAHGILADRPLVQAAVSIDRLDLGHVPPRLAAERAGIHREGASERAGNPRKELCRPQAPLHALPRDPRAGNTRLSIDRRLVDPFQAIERAVRADDDALDAPVAHENVASQAHPLNGHFVVQRSQERRQVRAVARCEEHFRGPAYMPGRMPAHRLVALHAGREFDCDCHGHGCSLRAVKPASRAGSS